MENLNSLSNSNCFNILQEKLNDWNSEFQHNCTEINISKCCELLEINARIQTQLFKLLGFCGIYGDLSGSERELKKQLAPYMGKDYFENGLTSNIVIDILNDIGKQTRKPPLNGKMSNKKSTQINNCSKDRIENGSSDYYGSDSFVNGGKNCSKIGNQGIYEKLNELENIIIDMSHDTKKPSTKPTKKKKKPVLARSDSYSKSSEKMNESTNTDNIVPSDTPGDFSGSDVEEIRNDTYLQCLVGKYNDLFSEARVNAMDHLRLYNDDHENNQRMLFALVMIAAKCVVKFQRSYRSTFSNKPNQAFREAIPRTDLKKLRSEIIYELINNRGNYFRFHMPHDFSFVEMESLINRTIQLFWNFGGARNQLRLLEAADGEMFDEHKYRRSYDSDSNGPLVNHHIWPSLIQNHRVLVKGEACTRASNKMLCSIQAQSRNMFPPNTSKPSRCSDAD